MEEAVGQVSFPTTSSYFLGTRAPLFKLTATAVFAFGSISDVSTSACLSAAIFSHQTDCMFDLQGATFSRMVS